MTNDKWKILNIKKPKVLFKALIFALVLYLLFHLVKSLTGSLFFHKKDRLNVVFYGSNTRIISIGLDDGVNYYIPLSNDLKLLVPGGYGYYRVGGLGKLVELEKKPEIFKKTFSANFANFTRYYFYPKKTMISFGSNNSNNLHMPSIMEFLFEQSNASLFDRFYLHLLISGKNRYSFKIIDDLFETTTKDGSLVSQDTFIKTYQGNFYETTYRNEKRNVQVIYTKSYQTAKNIAQIIEGEGIRVVDLSEIEKSVSGCSVIEDRDIFSDTAKELAGFFDCRLEKGKTQIFDIIVKLGDLENKWVAQ